MESNKQGNINPILSRLDFGFLISIAVGLIGFWYFLYNSIIANPLPSLVITHYIVTVYLLMTIALCFMKGLSVVQGETIRFGTLFTIRLDKFQQNLVNIYFYSWLPALILSIILLITSIFADDMSLLLSLVFVCLVPIVMGLLFAIEAIAYWKQILIGGISIVVGFFVFIFVVSTVSMDVEINTDKQFYNKGDTILVFLKTKCYMYQPVIGMVSGGIEIPSDRIRSTRIGLTWIIPADLVAYESISVSYRHPKINSYRTKSHEIHICP